MSANTMWIVIAVVALLVIIALVLGISRARNRRRQRQAEEIREQAKLDTARVERREALAQETAAKARAAQAEAEAKAAEAARLQERAANHHSEVATARESLQEQWNRAESLDPKAAERAGEAGRDEPNTAWSSEDRDPTTDVQAVRNENYRGAHAADPGASRDRTEPL